MMSVISRVNRRILQGIISLGVICGCIFVLESHVQNLLHRSLDVRISSENFEDEYFQPLMQAYRLAAAKNFSSATRTRFRNGQVPRVLLYSRPLNKHFWNTQLTHIKNGLCPLPCEVTFDRQEFGHVDAVIIYLRGVTTREDVQKDLHPRDPSQPWIVLSFEAPPRANSIHRTSYATLNGLFNRTMFYRRDADIIVPHGFIVSRGTAANYLPPSWRVNPVMETRKVNRRLAVVFMSNCHNDSGRMSYIRALEKLITLDFYGKCGRLKCGNRMYVDYRYNVTKDKCLKMAGESYLFYLAFENSLCTDYVTEKLYNLLYYPIVPVVRGSANYSAVLPPNSYIDAMDYTPEQLALKLTFLSNHPEEYQKYLLWRQYFQPSTYGGERTLCHLCVRLHDETFYEHHVIDDFQYWFSNKSHC